MKLGRRRGGGGIGKRKRKRMCLDESDLWLRDRKEERMSEGGGVGGVERREGVKEEETGMN